jgi:hypothetical protein
MAAKLTEIEEKVLRWLVFSPRIRSPFVQWDEVDIFWLDSRVFLIAAFDTGQFYTPAVPTGPELRNSLDGLVARGLVGVTRKDNKHWQIKLNPAAFATFNVNVDKLQNKTTPDYLALRPTPAAANTPPSEPSPGSVVDKAESPTKVGLARFLEAYFDKEDLKNLCFDLGVDYENLPGQKKESKARDLVSHMEKRGRLEELKQAVKARRTVPYEQTFG